MHLSLFSEEDFLTQIQERTALFLPKEVLSRLREKTVSIVGCGGVGCVVVELLARWGIKRFRLADMDKFEPSNMNRQIYAIPDTIGHWKADTAAKRIVTINPFAQVELALNEKLGNENVEGLVKGADIVINEADTRSSSVYLHRAAQRFGVPIVRAAGDGMGGVKVHVFDYRRPRQRTRYEPFSVGILNRLCQRLSDTAAKLPEHLTAADADRIDGPPKKQGSLNFTVTTAGALAATQAIKVLIGKGKVHYYPKVIQVELFSSKMKVYHEYSPGRLFGLFWRHRREVQRNFSLFIANISHALVRGLKPSER